MTKRRLGSQPMAHWCAGPFCRPADPCVSGERFMIPICVNFPALSAGNFTRTRIMSRRGGIWAAPCHHGTDGPVERGSVKSAVTETPGQKNAGL
jgi:hypothetical protein